MILFKAKKIGGLFIFLAAFAAIGALVMWLWNSIIPCVIGWNTITYLQALGLMILGRLLLGGFGRFHGRMRSHWEAGHAQHHQYFHDMHEKMHKMSREERKEYILRKMAGYRDPFRPGESSQDNNTGEENSNNAPA